ncbi:MAG: iron ABC transporter permease [Candidatus Saganbacteria bacterium]|nr:iron ABC transporter permease [Candidatus Saganbacteria bacterium]
MKQKYYMLMLFLTAALCAVIVLGVLVGAVGINPFDMKAPFSFILWQIRLPRVILAALVGAMLAVSGAILQSSLKNPLCDPYILGISAGGSVAAAAAIILLLPLYYVSAFAFLGAVAGVFIIYHASKVAGEIKPQTLILAGVAVSSLLSAILSFMVIFSDRLQSIFFWILGSFSAANWASVHLAFYAALAGIIAAMIYSRDLNALALGDEEALSLGVDVMRSRNILLIIASLMTGVAVSLCGMIGFIGLIVPHMMRLISGSNNSYLIPASALAGAVLMVLADIISRVIMIPSEIPVGIVCAMLGAPFFIYLLRRS